ncbi:MAG: hypothetical protein IPK83_08655 [Planctomycetes bacterium]|nr:hypothetical protein [Planctomycetota bacterium]
MTGLRVNIKEWIPAAAALSTVVVAVVFALSRTVEVSDSIRNMDELAVALDTKASDVRTHVKTQDEIAQISVRRIELEQRFSDSKKPGIVVSQLSEAARNAGLQVLEIQPMTAQVSAVTGKPGVFPNYRVVLRGEYQQIASYLESCKSQRVPVRVIALEMKRYDEEREESSGDELRADIVVEAFHLSMTGKESQQGRNGESSEKSTDGLGAGHGDSGMAGLRAL